MNRKLMAAILSIVLAALALPGLSFAAPNDTDIVILYENDVHCAVEGYARLAAMKTELMQDYAHVGVVSAGDYAQGGSLGAVSQGEYIIELMNLVGYDAAALGNHEFDYRLPRLYELADRMETQPVCCNFRKIGETDPVFEPYALVAYGDVEIAYIGITTPSTLTSSSPKQFLNAQGEYEYTFGAEELYTVVQEAIDQAKAEGADYVVALSHIGYAENDREEDVVDLIENTAGFDAVLDGHSHSVIECMTVADRNGNSVVLSSTGSKFAYVGKLTIAQGEITTELIPMASYTGTDAGIDAYIAGINESYSLLGERKVGFSQVDLITHDAEDNRLVRIAETNLGDLCADAFRYVTGADIGYINGGGIRSDMAGGDLSFNDLLNVFPFNNLIGVAEVSGQVVLDMLEMAVMSWPEEDGAFPHVSGVTFCVDTSIPTSVTVDEDEVFIGVDGPYRVYHVNVWNGQTGRYEPLDLAKTYTLAAQTYFLVECGSGMQMFKESVLVQNDGVLDVEVLAAYLTEHLNGVVGSAYAEAVPNITFTEGRVIPE